jgi:hypothetical protein
MREVCRRSPKAEAALCHEIPSCAPCSFVTRASCPRVPRASRTQHRMHGPEARATCWIHGQDARATGKPSGKTPAATTNSRSQSPSVPCDRLAGPEIRLFGYTKYIFVV